MLGERHVREKNLSHATFDGGVATGKRAAIQKSCAFAGIFQVLSNSSRRCHESRCLFPNAAE
jgi:hypothetical protein